MPHRLPSGEGGGDSPDTDRSPDTGLDAGTDECSAAQHNSTSSYTDSGAEESTTTSPQYRYGLYKALATVCSKLKC
jgi:hypothetical protein